jgi:hypothetical protein
MNEKEFVSNKKEYNIGDLVEYKQKLHLVVNKQVNMNFLDLYTYMYRLDGIDRWILGQFVYEVEE